MTFCWWCWAFIAFIDENFPTTRRFPNDFSTAQTLEGRAIASPQATMLLVASEYQHSRDVCFYWLVCLSFCKIS